MKTVIVGGVAGGASAAARLRRLDERSEIVLLERGEYISFANCGLPYYVGGEITEKSALTLQTPKSFYNRFRIDVRVLSEVVSIDRAGKTVTIHDLKEDRQYTETYDKLILSTGAEPLVPPIEGAKSANVFTLRNIPDAYAIRDKVVALGQGKKAVIVGGGYIGVEMAENLLHAGLDVTIVEMADHLIAPLDADMAADVHHYAEEKGLKLMLGSAVTGIVERDGSMTVTTSTGDVAADVVILSVGVRPESRLAKEAGLPCNAKGGILVDDHMRTEDENIYAVGDAVEITEFVTGDKAMVPLAGPANKQGRIAADNICGLHSRYTGTQGSAVLKLFDMTIATTGLNERTAKAKGIDCDKVFLYSANHAGYYPGSTMMSMKVIFETLSGRILGAQIVGFDGVDKRCDVLATAIRFNATGRDLAQLELCYAPPFGSAKDPVNMAGFVIENIEKALIHQFHWHDVAALPRDGSVQLLDVRTPSEAARGMIDGFTNIPLDELRQHLKELDRTKPIYVHCHSGLRSYLACRILTGEGFHCYNLAGGYRLYQSVTGEGKPPVSAMPCKK